MAHPDLWRRTKARIGHRGAVLLFFSFLDFVYALSLFSPPAEAKRSLALAYIGHVLPLSTWGFLWGGVGVVLLLGAFSHRDRWAFAAGVCLKVLWGGTYLMGWLLAGLDRGWLAAAIWLALAVMLYIISDWPEP